ncbi:5-formyltetrahydrofolate cyclo-ligase [Candidatus Curtissbacteria bacterium RIFCSPHIGHO2_12_FULL_38_9b]|uniref:5-formyltetrahydrofolate cyclo-ligase n=2 Tax=Candidatus Curtissiibacteriota TaxID=1752717 RepID=A0A1F5GWX8_9BACT|nr:MAG: 5-formyltetrahydrofolate cyclo-ligase [Candidatus Curtissbacteria bacterium RIFCSPLOWO2_01_FULL_37_9]OGD96277.1 MAG: 5-formyltetrahydrofolate cyclo-ligase [Candidatus Curtissbacteria bacterium RIFCSPHIGHO2_12_FULL_38_9b]
MKKENDLRKYYLEKRLRLNSEEIENKSSKIAKKLLSIDTIISNKHFSIYLPVKNEVITQTIIDHLDRWGKVLVVPCFFKKDKEYKFAKFNKTDVLIKGPYDIPQPKFGKIVNPDTIEIAILPGLAFSKNGVRLGYGKGVFDKLLAISKALKVGLAYDFQVIDKLPKEKHDLKMDIIITESKVYRF